MKYAGRFPFIEVVSFAGFLAMTFSGCGILSMSQKLPTVFHAPLPTISLASGGNSVSLAASTASAVTVAFSSPPTSSGTLTWEISGAGTDFQTTTGTVPYAAGVSTVSFSILPDGYTTSSGTRTYSVTVTAPSLPSSFTASILVAGGYVCTGGPTTFTTNMNGRFAIGQNDLTTGSANAGGGITNLGLNVPLAVIIQNSTLFITDAANSRVMVYTTIPTASGAVADKVIGQGGFNTNATGTTSSSFTGLQALAANANYLVTGEWTNARFLLFDMTALATNMAATYVVGQPNMISNTSNNGGVSATSINNGTQAFISGTRLFIADSNNNRVLIYNTIPTSNNAVADVVVGQTTMSGTASGSGLDQLNFPLAVYSDDTRLFIGDTNNNRVLVFNQIPTTNGASADYYLGGWGIPEPVRMQNPIGVWYSGGKLFVADKSDSRVLVWNTLPTVTGTAPDAYLGQPDGNGVSWNQGGAAAANSLGNPHWLFYDGCRLFVADRDNNRVVVY